MTYTPDLTTAALKMVFSLALVLAVVWMLYRWARRMLPAGAIGNDGRLVKVLASHHLGVKKSIMVVQVPGSVLVLGIGAEQVNLLSRIDDPDLIAGLAKVEDPAAVTGFREQLDRMMRPLRGKSTSVVVAVEEKRVAR